MKRIVIFASGNGTNAENIIKYFLEKENAKVSHVFSNVKNANVLNRARLLHVETTFFNKEALYTKKEVLQSLEKIQPDLIVLAGFLWIFPKHIIDAFPKKIINIHPSLLPKFGGKGMYGKYVHEAVVAQGGKRKWDHHTLCK